MATRRFKRRSDGVVQIGRPRHGRLRPAALAMGIALASLPITIAVLLVVPVLLLEIPPLAATGAIVFFLLFLDRRRAARTPEGRRRMMKVVHAVHHEPS